MQIEAGKPYELTFPELEDFIGKEGIVLLDFWASWCGPCRAFAPIFEQSAAAHPDVRFGKVDTEKEQQLAAMFQIRSIPTVMMFRDGVPLMNQPGMVPREALEDVIQQARNLNMDEVRADLAKRMAEAEQA